MLFKLLLLTALACAAMGVLKVNNKRTGYKTWFVSAALFIGIFLGAEFAAYTHDVLLVPLYKGWFWVNATGMVLFVGLSYRAFYSSNRSGHGNYDALGTVLLAFLVLVLLAISGSVQFLHFLFL